VGAAALACALLGLVASSAPASDWTGHPLGGEGAEAQLFGISCVGTSLCVAVGGNNTIASSAQPLAPGGWAGVHADEGVSPGNPNQRLLKGVACPTTGLCVAVSFLGKILTSTDPTGPSSAWNVIDFDPVGPNIHFYGISCPSTGFCVAVAGGGVIAVSSDPGGGPGAWTVSDLGVPLELRGVSCTSPSFCLAVGDDGTEIRPSPGNEGVAISSTAPGAGIWSEARLGVRGSLYGVSCPTTGLCVTGDMFGSVLTTPTPTAGASGWNASPSGATVQITAASCSSPTSCLLTDDNGDVITSAEPLGGAGSWTVQNLIAFPTDAPVHNGLFSASCPTRGFCAVGAPGKVLTSTEPAAAQAAPAPAKGGGAAPKKPARHKHRPSRPRVILTSREAAEVAIPGRHTKLRFQFHAPDTVQVRGFVCSFDHRAMHPCRSPQTYPVGPGRHKFRVRAVGWTGLRGPREERAIWVCRRPGVSPGSLSRCRGTGS
jgi:hypothetical protein